MSWSIYERDGNDGSSSLVSPEKLKAAQEHKITIEIMDPNNRDSYKSVATVEGFMKEQFTYSVKASYENIMGYEDPKTLALNLLKDYTQRNGAFNSGYGSKRMFQVGNSYVSLNLKFRVYDDPNVMGQCDLLSKCCLPLMSRNSMMLGTDALAVMKNAVVQIGDTIGQTPYDVYSGDVTKLIDTPLTALASNITTRMPPHLRVSVGSYFKKSEMVLMGGEFTLSKEFSKKDGKTYPTYVDFDLNVESLYSSLSLPGNDSNDINDQIFGPGFTSKSSKESRVFVEEDITLANNILEKGKQGVASIRGLFPTPEKTP